MSDEMDFFIYLLMCYADHKGRTAHEVLREWDERGVTQMIYDSYWGYHTEAIENAYEDIDSLVATGKRAW
jgi:hypothetical protein